MWQIERLRRDGPDQLLMRKLQRFTVGLYPHERQALVSAGDLEEYESGFGLQVNAATTTRILASGLTGQDDATLHQPLYVEAARQA